MLLVDCEVGVEVILGEVSHSLYTFFPMAFEGRTCALRLRSPMSIVPFVGGNMGVSVWYPTLGGGGGGG